MKTPPRRRARPLSVRGSLALVTRDGSLADASRIALLRAVGTHGSITRAAQECGMSYRSAWDAIETINALVGEPLVERVAGGRGGGSTRLTPHGERLVARFTQLEDAHARFVHALDDVGMDLTQDFSIFKVLDMRTSARNQWEGTISAVRAGAVNDEVEITLTPGVRITAIVTRASAASLGLRVHQHVLALVKAPAVMLAVDLGNARISADNRLDGAVARVTEGAVNAEVVVATDGGVEVVAIVPQGSVEALGLREGARVTALVKPSEVVLAVVG